MSKGGDDLSIKKYEKSAQEKSVGDLLEEPAGAMRNETKIESNSKSEQTQLKLCLKWTQSSTNKKRGEFWLKEINRKELSKQELIKEHLLVMATGSTPEELFLSPNMDYCTVISKLKIMLRDWRVTREKIEKLYKEKLGEWDQKRLESLIGINTKLMEATSFLSNMKKLVKKHEYIKFDKTDFAVLMRENERRHQHFDLVLDKYKSKATNEVKLEINENKRSLLKRKSSSTDEEKEGKVIKVGSLLDRLLEATILLEKSNEHIN